MDMETVLEAFELHKHYHTGEEEVRALDGLNLKVGRGEFVAVMGASGSGKSTFLHMSGGLDTPTSGTITVEGQDLSKLSDYQRTLFRRKRIGIVFQQFNLLPGLSARENVALPLLVDGAESADIRRKTDELLEIVHLQGRANHLPQALSGGEQQRLAIARALINNPAVVLADEPTGNLDSRHSVEIWQLLRRLAADQQVTIVLVSHEAQGASYADRVCVLHDGKLLGEIIPERIDDAALVAARYQELTS